MKKQGFSAFLRRKQYVIAGAIVAIAAVGTTMLYSSAQEEERQQLEAELAEEVAEQSEQLAAEESTEEAAAASSVIPPKTQSEGIASLQGADTGIETAELADGAKTADEEALADGEQTADNEADEDAAAEETAAASTTTETLHFSPEDGMVWPLEGDVILNYSMDSTVYFATLDQYKYNPAVIIAGEVNDKVISVAKGKVTDISNSEETGCTMTVDLGDGYQAIYGQIKEPNFEVGDYVEAGHVLGFVAEPTKYYSVEGSNLYFALEKDGEPIDPVAFFE